MSEERTPWARPSAKKLAPPAPVSRAAKVRFRIKGSGTEGDLYQGQTMIRKCTTCGKR